MKEFDYERYTVVGYADILLNGNANVEVVGYLDNHTDFHKLNAKERIDVFPPKGRIFAHNFKLRNEQLDKHLVSINVLPNEKPGDNLDAYIWDKSGNVDEFGEPLTVINDKITDDGEHNYVVFQENDLIETEENLYVLTDDKILYVKANNKDRLIPYWVASKIDIIETPYGKKFIDSYDLPDEDGIIDITNDDQLINWFLSKILKKNWLEIQTSASFKTVEARLLAALNDMKGLSSNICQCRFDRLKKINTNFTLTLEELQELENIPFVKDVITKSVEIHKKSIISEASSDFKQVLAKLKEEHDLQIEMEKERFENEMKNEILNHETFKKTFAEDEKKLLETIDEKKFEIEILDETISSKNKEVESINELVNLANERKESLISDFAIIKDVLGIGNKTGQPSVQDSLDEQVHSCAIHSIKEVSNECIVFEAFGKSLEDTFKANKLPHNNATTIAETLAAYNTLLVPDVAYAMSIIHASQRCYYGIEYVNVGWKSFENLWTEGLGHIVEHCYKEPDIMHYLVLQNINLSYLPNFMQPLIDVQMGITGFLTNEKEYPANLRILCTTSNDAVLPMNEQCLKHIGCIEKPAKEVFVPRFKPTYKDNYGYLSPSKLKEREPANLSNFYKSYLDE